MQRLGTLRSTRRVSLTAQHRPYNELADSGRWTALSPHSGYILTARPLILVTALLLSNLDDDLAFCTSCFDVSHRLFGRFKWEDPVQDRSYGARLDERTDLSQLIPACSHEKKRIVDLMTFGLSSDPEA